MAFNERLAVIISAVGGDRVVKTFDQIGGSAKKAAGDAQNSLSKGVNGVLQRLGVQAQVTGGQVGAGLAAGAAVGAAALIEGVKHGVDSFINLTSQARQVQRVTGTTAETASTLAAIMRHLGIDVDTGAVAFARAEKNIGTNEATLKKWGVTVARDSQGNTDFYKTLLNIVDAYQNHTDQATRAAIVSQVFGRGYQALLPLLGKSRAEIAALGEEAEKHHEVFSQEQLDKGREFTLTARALHEELGGLSAEVGSAVVPSLTDMVAGLLKIIETADQLGSDVASVWDKVPGPIKTAGRIVTDVTVPFKGLADEVLTLGHHSGGAARKQAELRQEMADLAAQMDEEAAAAKKAVEEVDKLAETPIQQANAVERLRSAEDKLAQVRAEDPAKERADAEKEVTAAVRDQTDASDRLAKAKEKLAQFEGAALDLARRRADIENRRAQVSAQKAKDDLTSAQAEVARLKGDTASTPEQIAKAQEDLADAQVSVDEAQQSAADSAQKVNDLRDPKKSDDYKTAQQDVADATQAVADANAKVATAQKKVQDLKPEDHARKVEQAERDVQTAVLDVAKAAGDSANEQIAALQSIEKMYPELTPFIDGLIAKLNDLRDAANGVWRITIPPDSWWWQAHPFAPGNPTQQGQAVTGDLVGAGAGAAAAALAPPQAPSDHPRGLSSVHNTTFNTTVHAETAPELFRKLRDMASLSALTRN